MQAPIKIAEGVPNRVAAHAERVVAAKGVVVAIRVAAQRLGVRDVDEEGVPERQGGQDRHWAQCLSSQRFEDGNLLEWHGVRAKERAASLGRASKQDQHLRNVHAFSKQFTRLLPTGLDPNLGRFQLQPPR